MKQHETATNVIPNDPALNPCENDHDLAINLNYLGATHNTRGNYQESIECHYQALKIYTRLDGQKHADSILNKLDINGSYAEAKEYHYKKYEESLSRFGGTADSCPDLNMEFHRLADSYGLDDMRDYDDMGDVVLPDSDIEQAIKYYTRVLYMQNRLEEFYEDQIEMENFEISQYCTI